MSQSMVASLESGRRSHEFDYKPVPVIAPLTLFLGVCSAVSLLAVAGVGISVFGIILGLFCLRRIRRSDGELGGKLLASAGFWMSVAFLLSGSSLHAYTYATEVPEGYLRVSFTNDVSKKKFVYEKGRMQVHPDVRALDGRQIFIKGYMYPTRQTKDLTTFILVKDNGQCCFGGQPAPSDMILVEMKKGMKVDYRPQMTAVGGVFRLNDVGQRGELSPIYELEGTHFEPARTSF